MEHDLIGSKNEIYNELKGLEKREFIKKFDSLLINGKWGSGKSYFIDVIKRLAKQKSINVLVVDAWELEYLKEPERMIMVELLTNRELNITTELAGAMSDKLKKMFDEYVDEVDGADLKVEKIFKRSIKTINSLREDSNEFKYMQLLDELAFNYLDEKLLDELNIEVIIFDELDRVLPETFIETIKFIKYFSGRNANVSLSVALNLEQCNSMIKHLYGEHFSSEVYLDKVFQNELQIVNYSEEKARYIYNIVEMPDLNAWRRVWTIKQTICNYYSRGLDDIKSDNVGFGFKSMELRDITNFVEIDLADMIQPVRWHDSEYEENLKKVMIIFYMMYNEKYYKHINSLIYSEVSEVQKYPYMFKSEVIDIPCEISEEHKSLIEKFKNSQSTKDIKNIFSQIATNN